jgi:hypothetical protein
MSYWPVLAYLCAVALALVSYRVGRAFQREEHISMQLENIHLRGSLDREAIRARAAEEQTRRLQAQISLEGLQRVKEKGTHVRAYGLMTEDGLTFSHYGTGQEQMGAGEVVQAVEKSASEGHHTPKEQLQTSREAR